MENAKANLKDLLIAVQERLLTPNAAAKGAVAEVAARNGVNSSSLLTCHNRNMPKRTQRGNRLLTEKQEDCLVWALQSFSHHNTALAMPLCKSLAF